MVPANPGLVYEVMIVLVCLLLYTYIYLRHHWVLCQTQWSHISTWVLLFILTRRVLTTKRRYQQELCTQVI